VVAAHVLIIAALYLLRDRLPGEPSWRAFFRYVFPREICGSRSTRLDAQILLANLVSGVAALAPIAAVSALTAEWLSAALTAMLGARDTLATALTPLTTYRQHPFDQIVDGILIGLTTGIAIGVLDYRYMGVAEPLTVLGTDAGAYLFFLAGAHLRHSHLWLSYPAWLSRVLISPAQHQIHHSTAERHRDVNFGNIFSVWDALAGTLYVPQQREELKVGLAPSEQHGYSSLVELYGRPVVNVLGKCRLPTPIRGQMP
jgi:hypothetical protein